MGELAVGCRRIINGSAFVALASVLPLIAMSCGGKEKGPEGTVSYQIDRKFERGPVSFRVAVSSSEITIADHVKMLLETRAQEGYRVELPSFGEKLQQFGIVDYSNPKTELGDGGVVVTRRFYELEPFLSGEYRIEPMTVSFWHEGDTLRYKLESDTVVVNVLSILPEDQAGLEIKDIAGPVSFPSNPFTVVMIVTVAVGVCVLAVLLLRRRRVRLEEEVPVPPHDLAYMQLESLLSGGLLEEKRYGEFTARVSDILRLYIENRFRLRAPERTTEEFLVEARTGLPVDTGLKSIIEEFLVHCDLVKFAALEPSAEDVKKTFDTCRDFIDATKPGEGVREEAA